jgi:hypothetical protein
MSLGLLVYGDNHLILRGPRPMGGEAAELSAHFGLSMARIAPQLDRSGEFRSWQISTRELREDLAWVAVVPASTPHSAAVSQLLAELAARGVVADLAKEIPCAVSFP